MAAGEYRGKVVYHYAFDIAYEMGREPIKRLLGRDVSQFTLDATRRSPRQMFFYRPQMVTIAPMQRLGPRGPLQLEITVKIIPIGAISISVSVPFVVDSIEELVVYHDLRCDNAAIYDEVRKLAEQTKNELNAQLIRPVEKIGEEEAYTVFCIEGPLVGPGGNKIRAEAWLDQYRREVAALLTQEDNSEALSEQEMLESTGRSFSYYDSDLVVIDWDAALVIDEPQDFAEILYIMEIANLQLAELEAYDQLLDHALERSYTDLRNKRWRARRETLRDLKEIRVDLARFSDELSNITKFFGDWHLARVYEAAAARFHLADWHRTIDDKLATLDNLYAMLSHEQNNRWMLILEGTIVLLFIIDLWMLFVADK